ncbi:MAG TPA: amidohydrolase family protein [bacterium]|nr:amidohydrolase family protein [bacterium]
MSTRGVRIVGGQVLTLDGNAGPIHDGEVVVDGDTIAYVGPQRPAGPGETGYLTLNAHGSLVLPGLVNGHTHSYGVFAKGGVDGMPLDLFVPAVTALGEALRDEEDLYLAAALTAAEALRSGTTCLLDHLRYPFRLGCQAFEAAARGYLDAGVRATIAPMFGDRPFEDTLPQTGSRPAAARADIAGDADAYLAACAQAVPRLHGARGRMQFFLGTDGPQRCTPYLLRRSREFLDAYPVGMQSHVYETATQRVRGGQLYGTSLVAVLEDFGLLGPRLSLVHFVWPEGEDLQRVRRAGATVVHCPGANLQLGSGIAPVPEMTEMGIPVALGTDGANSLDLSLWTQIRLAALLHRVTHPWYRSWLTSAAVLRMATCGGAAAHRLSGQIGVLRAGAKGDVILLDPRASAVAAGRDPALNLVMRETGASVHTVLVGGEIVVRDGRCVRIDEADLLSRLGRRAEQLRPEVERRQEEMRSRYGPSVEAMYQEVMSSLGNDTRFSGPASRRRTPTAN